jgi:hypothetical protein
MAMYLTLPETTSSRQNLTWVLRAVMPYRSSSPHPQGRNQGAVHLLGSPNGRQRNSLFPDSQQPEQQPR